jgi:hypothetical protein
MQREARAEMKVKYLMYPLLLALPVIAGAAHKVSCSIHVTKPTTPTELKSFATVTMKDAETIALANLARKPNRTSSAVLEVEKSCLVWAFEFTRVQKPGLIKVLVDAGNGAFLSERIEKP